MADKRLFIAQGATKGPAGNVTVDKRLLIAQGNTHGSLDKRLKIAQGQTTAPPLDKRLFVAQAQTVGPAATLRAAYYGTPTGWVPVDIYMPLGGVWTKIT